MREYWVIEDSRKNGIFATEDEQKVKGYIPRSVGEEIIGRKTKKDECVWFNREQIAAMRAHPEWRNELPEAIRQHAGNTQKDNV